MTGDRPAVAFIIERNGPSHYRPVLLDAHNAEVFRCSTCVCADQAAYTATRGLTRMLEFRGMYEYRNGTRQPVDLDRRCSVTGPGWAWEHGHTHGALDKIQGTHNEGRRTS